MKYTDSSLRFEVSQYSLVGGFSARGLATVMATTLAAGLVLGVLGGVIAQIYYPVVILPLLLGLGLVILGVKGRERGQLRNPALAGFLGLCAGTLLLLTTHYLEYQLALLKAARSHPTEPVPWDATGSGFLDFIDWSARKGVRITGPGGGLALSYVGSYLFWFVEWVCIAGLATVMLALAARIPSCVACRRVASYRLLGSLAVEPGFLRKVVERGDLVRLAERNLPAGPNNVLFDLAVCDRCQEQGPIELRLREERTDDKGYVWYVTLAHCVYPGTALRVLERLFPTPPSPEPPSLPSAHLE